MSDRAERAGVGGTFLKLGGGEAASRLIAFAVTVYLARTLGASTYGIIVLASAILLYLAVLADCGVDMLGIHDVAAHRDRLDTLVPEVLGARLLAALGLIAMTAVVGLTLLPDPEGTVLVAYALTLVMVGLGTRWVHIGLDQAGRVAVARVATELVVAGIVVATVRGPADLGRVPLAQLVGEGVGAFLLLRMLPGGMARLRVRLRPALVGTLLSRSWPMVLHALFGLLIFNSDFIVLRILRDSAAVGQYAAAYTLISFFLNLATAYTMSLIPALTRLRDAPEAARGAYDTAMAQLQAGAVPVAVGGILVAPQAIALVFGAGYAGAATPLQVLLLLLPVAGIRHVAQGGLLAHGRQDQLLRTVSWAAGVNVALNLALIPRWGMAGAAAATVATELVRAVIAIRYTTCLGLPMTSARRFGRILAAAGVMVLLVRGVGVQGLWLTMALGAAGYLGTLIALGAIRFRRGALPELAV